MAATTAAPPMPELTLAVRFESAGLGLSAGLALPIKDGEAISLQKIVSAMWSGGVLGTVLDLKEAARLEKFEADLEEQARLRREQDQFYKQVQRSYTQTAETLQTMKRDYYREIDHLREQLSRQRRDPDFDPDNVFFFDPGAYQIPSWQHLVEDLDNSRMRREALQHELNAERLQAVPIHMVCEKCRDRFLEDGEEEELRADKCTETDACLLGEEQAVQTDWHMVLQPLAEQLQGAPPDTAAVLEACGLGACALGEWGDELTDYTTVAPSTGLSASGASLGGAASEASEVVAEEPLSGGQAAASGSGTGGGRAGSRSVSAAGGEAPRGGSRRRGEGRAEDGGRRSRTSSKASPGEHAGGRAPGGPADSAAAAAVAAGRGGEQEADPAAAAAVAAGRGGELEAQAPDLSEAARRMAAALERIFRNREQREALKSLKGKKAQQKEAATMLSRGLEALKRHTERMAFGRMKQRLLGSEFAALGGGEGPAMAEEEPRGPGVPQTRRLGSQARAASEPQLRAPRAQGGAGAGLGAAGPGGGAAALPGAAGAAGGALCAGAAGGGGQSAAVLGAGAEGQYSERRELGFEDPGAAEQLQQQRGRRARRSPDARPISQHAVAARAAGGGSRELPELRTRQGEAPRAGAGPQEASVDGQQQPPPLPLQRRSNVPSHSPAPLEELPQSARSASSLPEPGAELAIGGARARGPRSLKRRPASTDPEQAERFAEVGGEEAWQPLQAQAGQQARGPRPSGGQMAPVVELRLLLGAGRNSNARPLRQEQGDRGLNTSASAVHLPRIPNDGREERRRPASTAEAAPRHRQQQQS